MKTRHLAVLLLAIPVAVFAAATDPVNPFPGFPDTTTTAKAGEYVLTPSYNWLVEARDKGADKVTFIFYTSKLREPGATHSRVESFGTVSLIPNYMLIPLAAGGRARAGDIVLSWWQTGSGMKRCYVVKADNEATPEVVYLDIDWTNPARGRDGKPLAQSVDKLKADSFVKLTDAFAPGTTVAAPGTRRAGQWDKWNVITASGGKVLALGFAGRMAILEKSACRPLPVKPRVSPGDTVQVPFVGTFVQGRVLKVDPAFGRVACEIVWGGKTREVNIAFGDVATGLPL